MFKRTLALLIACANLLSPIFVIANEAVNQENSMVKHIAYQYVNGMFEKPEPTPTVETQEPAGFLAGWEKFKKLIDPKVAILTQRETQEMAFDIAAVNNFDTTIIDNSFIDKLELAHGGEESNNSLFEKIFKDRINTSIGKAHATLAFCHPTTDIELLQNRAEAILHLSKNQNFANALDSHLQKITPVEEQSLIFWHSKPVANQELLKAAYFGSMLQGLNTNTVALESLGRSLLLLQSAINVSFIPLEATWLTYLTADATGKSFKDTAKELASFINTNTTATQKLGLAAVLATLQAFVTYPMYCQFKSVSTIYTHIQKIMIATATHVDAMKQMSSLLNKNKELLAYLPSLQPLANLNNPAKHSAQLNKLLGMLDTNTFRGEASFFSITGRVLAAYELMKQVKDELAPVFAAAGELDMYVALAKLYNDHEDKNARYCMVDFVENSATPVIRAHNFWNPFISADKVVVNDVTFDASCPNSILTGPNTGGKSTVIKAIMLNVLMAQTFGIAPSRSLTMTPFAKLNCFMNISDDIATGASLFKSEVMRAKKLLDMVQGLQPSELSFVIIDEVFTGTSPQEGEQAALQFTKKLGTYKNNISIIATHYPKMTELETETNGAYRNLHVEILRNEDGSLNRTFKLKHGPTFENVAFDILQEEGLFV